MKDHQQHKFYTKQENDLKKVKAVAVVTIAVCQTAKARNTEWITRPRLKHALFSFFFQNPPKAESNGFKA